MDERTLWLQFQFHKGTIKPWTDGRSFGLGRNFNSIKVRLNRKIRQKEQLIHNFNSIKVRLNQQ